jgi:UDP-N-acetylglucosamine:LPS N-acetylglucosamine transferase
MLLDGELSGKAIAAFLEEVLAKPSLLEEMGRSAKELGRPDAASRLADFVCELAKGKS